MSIKRIHIYRVLISIALILLFTAIIVPISSCSYVAPPRDPYTLVVKLDAEPANLNPVLAPDAYERAVNKFIREQLIDLDWDTLAYKPVLAERWELSKDKLRLRFYLKKGIQWSDGVEFTADDVVYSFDTVKSPKVASADLKVYYIEVARAVKIDRYTVDFICTGINHMLLGNVGALPIIAKHIFDNGEDFNKHSHNRHPIGTGPYKFLRWKTGKEIVLDINERYHGKRPEIKKVVYSFVTEQSVALQMLRKGDLDVMLVRAIQWARQTNSDKFNREFYKLRFFLDKFSFVGWNQQRDLFKDRRVRLALTHLVNRKEIMNKLLFGQGRIATGPFFYKSKACNQKIKAWPYDPAKAKSLLREAGWSDSDSDGFLDRMGKKFSFTFTISSGNNFAERLASIMKEDFARAGIEMHVARYEWAVFLNKIANHDFDAVTLAWSNPDFQDDPYQIWHSSQVKSGSNYVNFVNHEADKLIEAARIEFDEAKRKRMYHRFHEIVHHEQPYTFLFNNPELAVVSKRFDNVVIHTKGLNYTEWKVKAE